MDRSIQWVVMRIKELEAQSSKKRKAIGTQGYRRTILKEQLEYYPPSSGRDVDLGVPTQETHKSQGVESTTAREGASSQPSLLDESTREVHTGSLHEQAKKDKQNKIEIHDVDTNLEATQSDNEHLMIASIKNVEDIGTKHILTPEDQWKIFEDAKKEVDAKAQGDALVKQQEPEAKANIEELARKHKEKEDLLQQEKEILWKDNAKRENLDLLKKIHDLEEENSWRRREKEDLEAKAKAAEEAQRKKDEEELMLNNLEVEEQAKQEKEEAKIWEKVKQLEKQRDGMLEHRRLEEEREKVEADRIAKEMAEKE